MTYVDRVRVVVCDHKNSACSTFFEFLLIVEHLLTFSDKVRALFSPIKTDLVLYYWSFCRWYRGVYFDVCRQSLCCNLRPSKPRAFYVGR